MDYAIRLLDAATAPGPGRCILHGTNKDRLAFHIQADNVKLGAVVKIQIKVLNGFWGDKWSDFASENNPQR
jgi:hypothetical protein